MLNLSRLRYYLCWFCFAYHEWYVHLFILASEATLGGCQTECHLAGAVKDPKVIDYLCKCPKYPKMPDVPKDPREPNDPNEPNEPKDPEASSPKRPPPKHRTPHLDPPNDDEVA
ncbi:hypothetical protein BGZ99_002150, partial [Dissophora globulifera]